MNCVQGVSSSSLRYSVRKCLCNLPKQQVNSAKQISSNKTSYESTTSTNKIVIPKRIERGPTDILKALSSTVKRDYTAPDYKYHDDPFLIPTSNMAKRMFALSQESGRKAARWIRQEHADLFQHRVADPPIEAFFPKAVYDEKSEVDENVLQKVISEHLVSDSITIYGLLQQKGVELTQETKQSLLELLCYYNSEDVLDEEWIEERWFTQGVQRRGRKTNTWKRDGLASKVFDSLSPPDSAAYAALLCGKAQFGDVQGAYKLYQEAIDAGLTLPVQVFNKMIEGSSALKENHEMRWQFVEEVLGTMKQQGVSPDLGTLNALLEVISYMSRNANSQKIALEVIAEFKVLGITPSLASYNFLLNTFCQDRSPVRSAILVDILDMLEGKSFTIRDPRDVLFFSEAMFVSRFHLSDVDVAYRVDKLLHTSDNYNLIGDSYKESVYYRNFFALVLQMSPLDEFMDLYNKLVPNVYVPEPMITEEIIKTVDMNGSSELLPRLWADIVMFEQVDREPLLCAMLAALQRSSSTDEQLVQEHANVAWDIWNRLENQREGRLNQKISWTGEMLSDILEVVLRADRYHQALEITYCLDKRQYEVLGVATIHSLTAFLEKSIEKKEVKNAIWCIQYCADGGFEETVKLAHKLSNSFDLSASDQAALANIVGPDALQKQSATGS